MICWPAGEPGLGLVPAEADGGGAELDDAGRRAHAGGPTPEAAPPSGGGETQVPQPGGAAHSAAAVSSEHDSFCECAAVLVVVQELGLNVYPLGDFD